MQSFVLEPSASSHSSTPCHVKPSPQNAWVQAEEQESVLEKLPSSHSSKLIDTTLSPQ
jgi:hypothetical protein